MKVTKYDKLIFFNKKGGVKLNIPGLIVITTGLIFLIYSVTHKNKININRIHRFIIVDKENFLKLQLRCSIFNSACMIIFGIIVIVYNLPNIYIIAYPLLFQFINYIIMPIGRVKHYIKEK